MLFGQHVVDCGSSPRRPGACPGHRFHANHEVAIEQPGQLLPRPAQRLVVADFAEAPRADRRASRTGPAENGNCHRAAGAAG